ncbi:ATP-dependent helicase [Marinifilum sp. RC60d5]|uniref:ATP-dependent helicase n=1 Tax=Marinifilum sp. RC60d5 TaxID=3458414 RepID=UPI004036D9A0
MSFKNLHRKFKNTEFSDKEFDPISAFETEGTKENTYLIPEERFSEPIADYSELLAEVNSLNSALAKALSNLNLYQQQAIFSKDKKLLLSAMVGSGKTTVLTYKILYLHFVKRVPLSQMAVLTFTNKAAREIKERILSFYTQSVIPESTELRYFGTFHSIARQLIKEHPMLEKLGFTNSFSIMDQETKDDFLQRLILSNELDIKYRNKLDKRLKLYKHEKQILYGNMKNTDDLPELLKLSQKEKQTNNLMDFDDLISVANWLLKRQQIFLPDWIVIDEFQDCNEDQLQLINYLSKENTHFFAVGDPNQSIYAWRGSTNKIFQQFVEDLSCKIMRLPFNYRTSGRLLEAAASLLQHEGNNLHATRPKGNKLIIKNHFDDNQEAYYYVQKFKELHKQGVPFEEIAILFRTRQQIAIFESIFEMEHIPCQVIRKISLREQTALFWLQKLLLSALHPNDIDSILQVFTSTDFGCLKSGKRMLTKFYKFSEATEYKTKLEAFADFLKCKYPEHEQYIILAYQLIQFPSFLQNKKQKDIYDFLALDVFLKPTSVHYKEYSTDIKNALYELNYYSNKNYFGNWLEIYQAAMSQVNLEGHFQINTGQDKTTKGVHLLSIHTAKGLEFDYVFLSGANTGIIPLERKKAAYDHLKEEKRLLFVALTRARNHIEISWHTQSNAWNAQEGPSYFLNSIPSSLIERIENNTEKNVTKNIKKEIQNRSEEKWTKGSKVKHPKYGKGIIVSCNNQDVVCDFGKFGEKSFASAWAPLIKI